MTSLIGRNGCIIDFARMRQRKIHTNWELSIKIVEVVQGAWLAKSFVSPCALAVLQSKPATEEP